MNEQFARVKRASKTLALLSDQQRNEILLAVADAIIDNTVTILEANASDLAKMSQDNPLYDRLQLTEKRLQDIASDMRNVATLSSPLGHVTKQKTLPNGLRLCRVSVPFGVIGMIYEARPNVTYDVFSLCFKSGNACLLKGGRDAVASNEAGVAVIHKVLTKFGVNPDVVTLLPATHEATAEMLSAVGYVDLCIPRGGRKLIVSVCNALDCLIIHESRLNDLPALVAPLLSPQGGKPAITLYCDAASQAALSTLDSPLIQHATADSFGTEFMDYKMAIKTVGSLDEALEHIDRYGSGHSEAIITANEETARQFQKHVDAACVYWNAPTSFTDGAQFGLGAEIGISTQKLGPRGPMALEEITTYKWLIEGEGQTRP